MSVGLTYSTVPTIGHTLTIDNINVFIVDKTVKVDEYIRAYFMPKFFSIHHVGKNIIGVNRNICISVERYQH